MTQTPDPLRAPVPAVEWPTLMIAIVTYRVWALGTTVLAGLWLALGIVLTGLAFAQFSSLQHEVLHGHPFRNRPANEALVFPELTICVPFGRFRDTHLAHHHAPNLTDPYDDPESNFQDPEVWAKLPRWVQALMNANNTLLGRMMLGPVLGNILWMRSEWRLARAGEPGVARDWGLNLLGLVPVVAWLIWVGFPIWAYLIAAWIGHGLLKIRTYLEHRAHDQFRARTVVVEDRGPLSWSFLNNNYHVAHHMHPTVPWYRLPALYAENRDHYLRRNEGYHYASYADIFRRYLLRRKDPVPHPIWPVKRA